MIQISDINNQKSELELLKSKLRWRSRRSLLELDLILQKFIDSNAFNLLSLQQLIIYQQLLKWEDSLLLKVILQSQNCQDKNINEILELIMRVT